PRSSRSHATRQSRKPEDEFWQRSRKLDLVDSLSGAKMLASKPTGVSRWSACGRRQPPTPRHPFATANTAAPRCRTSRRVFTPAAAASPADGAPRQPDQAHAKLETARMAQLRATDMLAKLLEASDVEGVARQYVESLNEEFFMTASAYMSLARKEGNAEVANRLERALSAAWVVKQGTLRLELQLLNKLVRAATEQERKQVYMESGADVADTLSMNERWFFSMLARMTTDVEKQPVNQDKGALLTRLRAIQKETEAIEKQAAKQAAAQQ
ncbi:hypothetical protein TSOC_009374, partial [Tetrabaena socialis]